jgi:protein transport protein SEC61 subunit gamma and related proteins
METQSESLKTKISSFILQCKRVWHLLRKPTTQEFKTIATVSAVGILILGAIGFAVADLIKIIGKFF